MSNDGRNFDKFVTYTPPELIAFCRDCPFPEPKCGQNGCKPFLAKREALQSDVNYSRRKRKEKLRKKKARCKA